MKKNYQSSWAMRLRKISALCLMLVASANLWAADNLTIKPNIKAGQTSKIAISLDNKVTDYTAFQMDIKLPAGLSIAGVEIVDERNDLHQVEFNQVVVNNADAYRVVAYSFNGSDGNKAFTGKSGNLLNISVTASNDFNGGNIEVLNQTFVVLDDNLTGVTDFKVANADVNSDCVVDTQDALKAIGYYLNEQYISAADVNGDNAVDTQDALKIIGIYLTSE